MKSQTAPIEQALTSSESEFLFNVVPVPLANIDQRSIHQLLELLPVMVFIPKSIAEEKMTPHDELIGRSTGYRDWEMIRQALERRTEHSRRSRESRTVTFGDVTIDFAAMEAFRRGEPVVLTTLEFKVLGYLTHHAGRAISRDELLNEVWGYDNYPTTRTVDNLILRLRQKLESEPSRPVHIRTMHGTGYRFIP